jgi:hypothetical protein
LPAQLSNAARLSLRPVSSADVMATVCSEFCLATALGCWVPDTLLPAS